MNSKYEYLKKEYLKNYEEVLKENDDYFKGKDEKTVKDLKELLDKALSVALDVRKFEIEMYWKRATYFWVFISVTFAAFFMVLSDTTLSTEPIYPVLVSFVGTVFSLSWYLVNRGSKYWQSNWEHHVDLLENFQLGPLYKLTIDNNNKFDDWTKSYPYSVSRINITISLFIFVVWIFLAYFSLNKYFDGPMILGPDTYLYISSLITLVAILKMIHGMKSTNRVDESFFKRRDE
ncbi:RipA family octameric membrane protein [Paracholeplasma manati]|uniref:RipA family octameric membrane protein n=1 Tax=Paracholeplasma manati TaxID=591373 RepID=UPI002407C9BD|nr:hypothetical protein [Paracholeplasma manati]MDG0889348.1 hypothetical protein [Paracholeplasma manati]